MSIFNGVTTPSVRIEYDAALPLGVKEPEDCDWTVLPTDLIRSISIRRGKTVENQLVQPGEVTFTLDNRSGDFDPMNDDSPYWIDLLPPYGGFSYFNANLGIRVIATWDEVDYVIYTGFLEQLNMDYGLNPTVTITCVDAMAWIAKQQIDRIPDEDPPGTPNPPVGNGDQVWFRCEDILDRISFPTGLRGIDTSVDNTLYGTRYGADALTLLQTTVDCNPARLYVDGDGLVRVTWWDGGDDAGLVLSDSQSAGSVGYDSIVVDPGSRYLINFVTVNKVNGDGETTGAAFAVDSDSVLRFGTMQATYELPTNTAAPVANALAYQYSEPIDRVREISFSMANLGSNFVKVLVTDIPDVVTVERTTFDGRALTFSCQVEGLTHEITPQSWRMSYIMSTNNIYSATSWIESFSGDVEVSSYSAASGDNVFYFSGSSASDPLIVAMNAAGTVQWQKNYALLDGGSLLSVALADDGSLAVAGYAIDGSEYLMLAAKVDNLGAVTWSKLLSNGLFMSAQSSVLDNAGGFIIVGGSGAYSPVAQIVKYAADGTLSWQESFTEASAVDVAVDSSDNVSFVASQVVTGTLRGSYVTKTDSTGTQLWQRLLTRSTAGSVAIVQGNAVSFDASGNVYVAGNSWNSENIAGDGFLVKYNSSGVLQWQRRLDTAYWSGMAISGSTVYLVGSTENLSGNWSGQIAAYTGGVLDWQCELQANAANVDFSNVSIDADGNLCVTGSTDAIGLNYSALALRLPNDGSGAGTCTINGVDFTYAPTLFAEDAGVLSDAAGSKTLATSSLTESTPTLTVTAAGLTTDIAYF